MIGKKWIDHIMNGVMEVNERRTMIKTIIKRKRKLIDYLIRHNQFIIIIIVKGKINNMKIIKNFV